MTGHKVENTWTNEGLPYHELGPSGLEMCANSSCLRCMVCYNYTGVHFWWVRTTNTIYYIWFKFMQQITKNQGPIGFDPRTPPTTNVLIITRQTWEPTTLFVTFSQNKLFKHMTFDPRVEEEHGGRVQHEDREGFHVGTNLDENSREYLRVYFKEYSRGIFLEYSTLLWHKIWGGDSSKPGQVYTHFSRNFIRNSLVQSEFGFE